MKLSAVLNLIQKYIFSIQEAKDLLTLVLRVPSEKRISSKKVFINKVEEMIMLIQNYSIQEFSPLYIRVKWKRILRVHVGRQ